MPNKLTHKHNEGSTVKLEVIDTDGAVTTQTVDVTVANVAPTVASILKPDRIKEGESVAFTATIKDIYLFLLMI